MSGLAAIVVELAEFFVLPKEVRHEFLSAVRENCLKEGGLRDKRYYYVVPLSAAKGLKSRFAGTVRFSVCRVPERLKREIEGEFDF